ncbi:unnamed protein product [Phytophthora fragariaefolia]|uniref:Unnamed protein product n=1 Tax=Phytophthora fragariaefolia TaxID=1490495 RepID=A0A9W6Y719_9STRA|nr:unnamed protein product [Phytophthora fragariaefolia]
MPPWHRTPRPLQPPLPIRTPPTQRHPPPSPFGSHRRLHSAALQEAPLPSTLTSEFTVFDTFGSLTMQRLLQFVLAVMTMLVSVDADGTRCNFTAVINVANEHYPGCIDLYNVLEQSMPVNFTSTLCDDPDCMVAIDELRVMDLGDCIVFGSTTLTSDILDQCKDATSAAWVGWVILALCLALFIPVVVYRLQYHRKKKAQSQLDLANGKLGINDAPYKVIDLAGTRV